MLNNKGERELAYLTKIIKIEPMVGYDNLELATINGWTCVVGKDTFSVGDLGVYFEIDSLLPQTEPFINMQMIVKNKFKIKTQRFARGKIPYLSQGLLLHPNEVNLIDCKEGEFVTERLGITYADPADVERKSEPHKQVDKYQKMLNRKPKLAKNKFIKWMFKYNWGKKIVFLFFGKKKDIKNAELSFPKQFPYIRKTDVERIENMPQILKDKTPMIVTQKCDGSSATYILERLPKNKFNFYVCSRNLIQKDEKQECYYEENYYWKMAIKYDIENKLTKFLINNPELDYICWQGEICGPKIQSNPHKLKELHLYCFHMIDSKQGKWDIRKAKEVWDTFGMETVPIIDENYILPDDLSDFKKEADGYYKSSVCEGQTNCKREGFVYYSTVNPNFFFKNVSNEYLTKKG